MAERDELPPPSSTGHALWSTSADGRTQYRQWLRAVGMADGRWTWEPHGAVETVATWQPTLTA